MNFEILFWLLVGHALADFPLQPEFVAAGKNRHRRPDPSKIPPGQKYTPCWPYFLSAHALVHGGAVALATGVWWLGALETAAHWLTDFGKCENWYGVHADQGLHLLAKLGWWAILTWGMTGS